MTIDDSSLEHPWQRETIDSGLMLHAPADLSLDLETLRDQAAAAMAQIAPDLEGVMYNPQPGAGWSRLLLRQHDGVASTPLPLLSHMPAVAELATRQGWVVQGIHLDRHPPRGGFPWHWDDQGLHLHAMRLLIPLHIPAGSRTRVGHESLCYPPGQAWTADFSFVHDVLNLGTTDRISLVFDLVVTPEVTSLFPAELAADPQRRQMLAARTREQLMQFWKKEGSRQSYPTAFRRTG